MRRRTLAGARAAHKEATMKAFSLFIGMFLAVVVIAVLLLVFGVRFGRPSAAMGAALYNPATETSITGVVQEVQDFTCAVSEREVGRHLLLRTTDGVVQVHLLPSRVLRAQHVEFKPGERVAVTGSKTRLLGMDALIAREVVRGTDTFMLRDKAGSVMMQQ
jgi:hypothetical protein